MASVPPFLVARWAPGLLLGLILPTAAAAYTTNGRVWPQMPIVIHVNPTGAPPMDGGLTAVELVERAAEAWTSVGCADVAFEIVEDPTASWAADGKNTIFWLSEDWIFNENAAGATLTLPSPPELGPEVDIALNSAELAWLVGGGDALAQGVVDPASVVTHELGHLLGLSHTGDVHATMYHALLPNGVQGSLDSDDRLGICTLYPSGHPDCDGDQDCPDGGHCSAESDAEPHCQWPRAQAGEPCNKNDLGCEGLCVVSLYECEQVCAFTSNDYSAGYCAPLCGPRSVCPPLWNCTEVSDVPLCTRPEPPLPTLEWAAAALGTRTVPIDAVLHDAGEWFVPLDGPPRLVREEDAAAEPPAEAPAEPPGAAEPYAEPYAESVSEETGCRGAPVSFGPRLPMAALIAYALFRRRRTVARPAAGES